MAPTLRPRKGTGLRETVAQTRQRELTHHISKDWMRQGLRRTPSRGFSNPGVLCYRNSLLQALLHIPKFVNWLELHYTYCTELDCVACAIKRLCESYWDRTNSQKRVEHKLRGLTRELASAPLFVSAWNWGVQNDVMEFYTLLSQAIAEGHPPAQSLVKGLFSFDDVTSLTCTVCRYTSCQHEDGCNQLIIPLEYPAPLVQILRKHLFGRGVCNGWTCSRCQRKATKVEKVQRRRLITTPEILVLQLSRFTWNSVNQTCGKELAKIPFAPVLDLTPYTNNNMDTRYRLISVIQHRGDLNSGHYKVATLSPSDEWEEIEDMNVRYIEVDEALDPGEGFTPYVLMYAKMDVGKAITGR